MATQVPSTPTRAAHLDPAADMLARLFPRWRGDASEPALAAAPRPNRPAPAAAQRILVEA